MIGGDKLPRFEMKTMSRKAMILMALMLAAATAATAATAFAGELPRNAAGKQVVEAIYLVSDAACKVQVRSLSAPRVAVVVPLRAPALHN